MGVKLISLSDLNRRAFDILARELGVPDAIRFFSQLGIGGGNYAEERKQLFANLTLHEYREGVQSLPPKLKP